MRALLAGILGVALLLSGAVAGTAGTALLVTSPCSPTYRLALQPAESVDEVPETTVELAELSEVQRAAVEAALAERTSVSFGDRGALAELADVAVSVDGGDRHVPQLVTVSCDTPYAEVALGGFAAGLVGVFLTSYAVLVRRLS